MSREGIKTKQNIKNKYSLKEKCIFFSFSFRRGLPLNYNKRTADINFELVYGGEKEFFKKQASIFVLL